MYFWGEPHPKICKHSRLSIKTDARIIHFLILSWYYHPTIFKYFWFTMDCMILILGRFQPLHNGHMKVIKDSYAEDKDVVIAIGSAGRSNEKNNPFSGEERKEMIENVLAANDIEARVILIPNTDSDTHYAEHVVKHIGRKPDKVITENQWTIDLFTAAGYRVDVTDRHFEISATDIRDRIANDKGWEDLVPIEVTKVIKDIDGIGRIRRLAKDTP